MPKTEDSVHLHIERRNRAAKSRKRSGPRVTVKPIGRNALAAVEVVERRAPPLDLTWPSGEGIEVATLPGSLDRIWAQITANVVLVGRDLSLYEIDDDGLDAVVLTGLPDGPVSFVSDPELAPGLLSVIADAEADLDRLGTALSVLTETDIQLARP